MQKILSSLLLLLPISCTQLQPSSLDKMTGNSDRDAVGNIFLVTIDGLRWQEVFRGLDQFLVNSSEYSAQAETIAEHYAATAQRSSAETLMPFLHDTVFKNGTVVGNRDSGSCARVSNSWYFSYPGYNEILTGVVDESIDSNAKISNANQTFLERLNNRDDYRDKVAAFGSWDVFPYILNVERSGLHLNAFQNEEPAENQFEEFLNRLQGDIPSPWGNAVDPPVNETTPN